jgi:hypothetical protein
VFTYSTCTSSTVACTARQQPGSHSAIPPPPRPPPPRPVTAPPVRRPAASALHRRPPPHYPDVCHPDRVQRLPGRVRDGKSWAPTRAAAVHTPFLRGMRDKMVSPLPTEVMPMLPRGVCGAAKLSTPHRRRGLRADSVRAAHGSSGAAFRGGNSSSRSRPSASAYPFPCHGRGDSGGASEARERWAKD